MVQYHQCAMYYWYELLGHFLLRSVVSVLVNLFGQKRDYTKEIIWKTLA